MDIPRLKKIAILLFSLYIVMLMSFFTLIENSDEAQKPGYLSYQQNKRKYAVLRSNSVNKSSQSKVFNKSIINANNGKAKERKRSSNYVYKVNQSELNPCFNCENTSWWKTQQAILLERNETYGRCISPKFLPANKIFNQRTAIASFPGCGNTWTRQLIEQVTGIWTGSLYRDSILRLGGFAGEGIQNNSVIGIKTHWPYVKPNASTVEYYDRVILVIRSPQECLLAEYNRRQTKTHTEHAPDEAYSGSAWKQFVIRHSDVWKQFYMTWLRKPVCTIIIDFSKLKTNLFNELRRIAKFLGVTDLGLTDRLKCIAKSGGNGAFKRSYKPHNFTMFNNELRRALTKQSNTIKSYIKTTTNYNIGFDW